MKRCRALLILLMLSTILAPAGTMAADFASVWVTFAFSDDNLYAGAEDQSPIAGFGPPVNTFYDDYDPNRRNAATMAHITLIKDFNSYFKGIGLKAGFMLELRNVMDQVTWESQTRIYDDGSFLKITGYFDRAASSGDGISTTFYPINSRRLRLGFSDYLFWGGASTWPGNVNPVPGLSVRGDFGTGKDINGYAFIGAKATRMLNEKINEVDTFYGFLGGAGIGVEGIGVEANGGYFEKGVFPPQGYQDTTIGGKPVQQLGGSAQVSYRTGLPIGKPVDFNLFRRDMDEVRLAAQPEQYDNGISAFAASEFNYLMQTMISFDKPNSTVIQPAMAGDLELRLKVEKFRVFGAGVYKDLAYILRDVPGLTPYYDFPKKSAITPELLGMAGLDYFFEMPHLTLGFTFGYKHPSTYKGKSNLPVSGVSQSIIVVRGPDDLEILPEGKSAFDIVSFKPNLKWQLADGFVSMAEVNYTIDKNQVKYKDDENGIAKRVFKNSNVTNELGFSLLVQASF